MRFFEHQQQARARTTRMVVLFALAVAGTALGVHYALVLCWWGMDFLLGPVDLGWPRGFLSVNIGVTLLLVLGGWWIEASNLKMAGGAERLARRMGAREARPSVSAAEQRLCNIVDEVCIAAHMPRPQVMVLPRHEAINAFATGWHADDGVVAVTQGALDLLTREELQGMVAHECSHILEGDTRLNMQLAGMVHGLEMVWGFGDVVRERPGMARVFGNAILWVGAIGWFAGRCLQAAVSREREFLADARAVQWTRSRDGLGGVLRKVLTQRQTGVVTQRASPAVQHLLLVSSDGTAGEKEHWLDSHPPLAARIRRIYGRPMGGLPLTAEAPARAVAAPAPATPVAPGWTLH